MHDQPPTTIARISRFAPRPDGTRTCQFDPTEGLTIRVEPHDVERNGQAFELANVLRDMATAAAGSDTETLAHLREHLAQAALFALRYRADKLDRVGAVARRLETDPDMSRADLMLAVQEYAHTCELVDLVSSARDLLASEVDPHA
jgi:hypothetical protein